MYRLQHLVLGIVVVMCALSGRLTAQVSSAMSAYTVAYVEIAPSARPAMLAALTQYRNGSRGESGHVRTDVFEQVGRPGHFVIVEAWTDQKAADAHDQTTNVKRFQDALQPIRLSGYDQRPYKPLSVAPAGDGKAAVHIVAHVDIGPGAKTDVPALLGQLAETSRKEPGNMRFDVLQHTMRTNHFTVVETWASQAALDAHAAAPHTRQYRDTVQPITGSPLDERVYTAVE